MPYFVLGTESTQLLVVDKDTITGTTSLFFSNEGDVTLFWHIEINDNPENVPWILSLSNGTVETGGLQKVTLSFNASSFQARSQKYITHFWLNTSSPTPTPHPISELSTVVVEVVVSATPSAEQSIVTLASESENGTMLTASETIHFVVSAVDDTARPILDAADVAYTASIISFVANTTVTCRVAYDAGADVHRGACEPPTNVAGGFAIKVRNVDDELVGGGAHRFAISTCPLSYSLDLADNLCKCPAGYDAPMGSGATCLQCAKGFFSPDAGSQCMECPSRETSDETRAYCQCMEEYYRDDRTYACLPCPDNVDCAEGSTLAGWALHPGYWRIDSESSDVRPCDLGVTACPGGDDPWDVLVCPSQNDPYCACGYQGPLCRECADNYFKGWATGPCDDCGETKGHGPTIILGSVLVVLAVAVAGAVVSQRKRITGSARFQSAKSVVDEIKVTGKVKAKVVFFAAQVISEYSLISEKTQDNKGVPEPASTFAGVLGVTNLDILGFGEFDSFLLLTAKGEESQR